MVDSFTTGIRLPYIEGELGQKKLPRSITNSPIKLPTEFVDKTLSTIHENYWWKKVQFLLKFLKSHDSLDKELTKHLKGMLNFNSSKWMLSNINTYGNFLEGVLRVQKRKFTDHVILKSRLITTRLGNYRDYSGSGSKDDPRIEIKLMPTEKESEFYINVDTLNHPNTKPKELSVIIASRDSKALKVSNVNYDPSKFYTRSGMDPPGSMQIYLDENDSSSIKNIELRINGRPVSEIKTITARAEKLSVLSSKDKIEIRLPLFKEAGKSETEDNHNMGDVTPSYPKVNAAKETPKDFVKVQNINDKNTVMTNSIPWWSSQDSFNNLKKPTSQIDREEDKKKLPIGNSHKINKTTSIAKFIQTKPMEKNNDIIIDYGMTVPSRKKTESINSTIQQNFQHLNKRVEREKEKNLENSGWTQVAAKYNDKTNKPNVASNSKINKSFPANDLKKNQFSSYVQSINGREHIKISNKQLFYSAWLHRVRNDH